LHIQSNLYRPVLYIINDVYHRDNSCKKRRDATANYRLAKHQKTK
jgi:hypothetical protein